MFDMEEIKYNEIGQDCIRKFTALESDILCECKTITEPIDPSKDIHNHDGHEILLVLDGSMNLYTEFGGIKLQHGNLICIHEFDFHRGELITKEKYDRIVINVKGLVLKQISSQMTDLESCFQKHPSIPLNVIQLTKEEISTFESCARSLQQSLSGKNMGDDLLIDAYLKQIMVMVNRHFLSHEIPVHTEIMPSLVVETFKYIENHLSEEITLKKLEDHIHHNGTYISRCFKKITGISLQQFIITKKIAVSCKLLREGHLPCDVCYMTGFNNYSNYSRTFSKYIGLSPKQYQMEHR